MNQVPLDARPCVVIDYIFEESKVSTKRWEEEGGEGRALAWIPVAIQVGSNAIDRLVIDRFALKMKLTIESDYKQTRSWWRGENKHNY